jgi:hypothetical protein
MKSATQVQRKCRTQYRKEPPNRPTIYSCHKNFVETGCSGEVTLRLTVCLGIEYPCGTCDQIWFLVGMLLSEICGLVYGGRPLWREDGSAICSVITQWSDSLRTRNHILLSHLRLPQPRGSGSRIYIPSGTGWPSYTPGQWLGSLYVVSYDSQGYGGGILTLPLPGGTGPCIYSL